jgi:hypothetical protein
MYIGLNNLGLNQNSKFSPLQIFQGGADGYWRDPNILSSTFQDDAGTIPGVVGQPVGKALDLSGRGNHTTQAVAGSRPTLTSISSAVADVFDGTDDFLTSPTGGGSTVGFFYCAAVRVDGGAGTARTLWSDVTGTNGYRLRVDGVDRLNLQVGNGAVFTLCGGLAGSVPVGSTYLFTAWDDGTNLNIQVGRGTVTSAARPVATAGTAGFTEGKDNIAVSSFAPVSIFNRVYVKDSGLTAVQRAQIQAYVAASAGLTL